MVELHQTYAALFALAAAVALTLAVAARRHRTTRGAWSLALLMLGVTIWAGASAAQWSVHGGPAHIAWLKVMYLGIWMTPVGFLELALDIARLDRWRTLGRSALIATPPLIFASLAWLNPGGLFHRGFTTVSVGSHTHYVPQPGPVYWAFGAVTFAMIAIGLGIIVRVHMRSSGPERVQTTIVLIGAVIPLVASAISETRVIPLNGLDLTPLGFLVTGGFWLTSLSLGHLLDVLPVARHALVEQMADGVVVLDGGDCIADANPAARSLLGVEGDGQVGQPAEALLGGLPYVVSGLHQSAVGHGDEGIVTLPLGCSEDCKYIDVRVTALDTGQRARAAHLVVLHDVTEERISRTLLETANAELEHSQGRIEALNEELHEQAIRDPLTGLYNRRYLDDSLPREIARSQRESESLGFLVLDIDDFKAINDRHTHMAGDAALVMVGKILCTSARAGDIVCRHGGDEFLVVMPGAGTGAVYKRAEGLRRQIEGRRAVWDDEVLPITVSIGVSSVPACGTTADEGVAAADRALYSAKESGRNKTVAAPEPEGSWQGTGHDRTPPRYSGDLSL